MQREQWPREEGHRSASRDVPRDPISGRRAIHEDGESDVSAMSSREIEREIDATRAHLSSTLNAIEARVSPDRIKREFKQTVQETVDEFNPQRIARKAGDNMLDTIKEHPVPALIAGLSVGYMFMKGNGSSDHERRQSQQYYRDLPYSAARGQSMYRDDVYPSRHPEYPARYASEDESVKDRMEDARSRAEGRASEMRDRAGETMHDARDRAGEAMHEVQDRAEHAMSEARHRARHMGRRASRTARRAEHSVEDFIDDNPLMAGLFAAGAGALLGSLIPSTRFENERVGPLRDDMMHRASDMVDEAKERAQHVAEDAKEELKESGEHIAESAKAEAKEMRDSGNSTQGNRMEGSSSAGEPRRTERGTSI